MVALKRLPGSLIALSLLASLLTIAPSQPASPRAAPYSPAQGPGTNQPAGADHDLDKLDDALELGLAQRFEPYLIFDEAEDHSLIETMLMLFQATPTYGSNGGLTSVMLTFVYLYRYDTGADIGGCYVAGDAAWAMLDIVSVFPGISKADVQQIKTGHCGDTESVKILVKNNNGVLQPTQLTIRRHGSETSPVPWASLDLLQDMYPSCPTREMCWHPRLWVSQNKHALYPSAASCEKIGSQEMYKNGVLDCTISWEDCDSSDANDQLLPPISDAQNVGEKGNSRYQKVGKVPVKNAENFKGEYIWGDNDTERDEIMCGGFKPDSGRCPTTGCGGSIWRKWEVFNAYSVAASNPRDGYFFKNDFTGLCLDVSGDPGKTNGSPVTQYTCEYGKQGTDQLWFWTTTGHLRNSLSGKCLDVPGASGTQVGSKLQLWDCEYSSESTDQRWDFKGGALRSLLSGYCVGAIGSSSSGNWVELQSCSSGAETQNWIPERWSQ